MRWKPLALGTFMGAATGVIFTALNHELRWIAVGVLLGAAIAFALPQQAPGSRGRSGEGS